jgi:hypothetical protein
MVLPKRIVQVLAEMIPMAELGERTEVYMSFEKSNFKTMLPVDQSRPKVFIHDL